MVFLKGILKIFEIFSRLFTSTFKYVQFITYFKGDSEIFCFSIKIKYALVQVENLERAG